MRIPASFFIRFIVAGIVGFSVSSSATPIVLMFHGYPEGVSEIIQACEEVVFIGVVVAAFCLPRAAQAAGALALLGLGLIFYCCTDYLRAKNGDTFLQSHPRPLFWPIAWGGLAAAAVHLVIYLTRSAISVIRQILAKPC